MRQTSSLLASCRRYINDIKQLSWPIITLASLLLFIGILALLDFGWPYPDFIGEQLIRVHQELGPEFVGIGITVLLIDTMSNWRSIQRRKRRLLRELGSSDNATALAAAYELKAIGWLRDGTIQGASLMDANLSDAKLRNADFSDVDLRRAIIINAHFREARLTNARLNGADFSATNFEQADLENTHWGSKASLEDANLYWTNLRKANLHGTNLKRAHMTRADLQDANLNGADLEGTLLMHANLLGASLASAKFNQDTRLPDSNPWRANTDLSTFTDQSHPQFWRSDDHESPAYPDRIHES
jgi:uncharacterized protein YjbI with pentapeptide repeats